MVWLGGLGWTGASLSTSHHDIGVNPHAFLKVCLWDLPSGPMSFAVLSTNCTSSLCEPMLLESAPIQIPEPVDREGTPTISFLGGLFVGVALWAESRTVLSTRHRVLSNFAGPMLAGNCSRLA